MEGLIALYLIYMLWKTTVEAATNIVAAVKGRPVVVGSKSSAEAEEVARYATRGAGTALGMLGWLLAQSARAARDAADDRYGERIHLAREKRRHVRAERRATRARRHAERRGRTNEPTPAPTPGQDTAGGSGQAPQACQLCGRPGTDTDPLVTNGPAVVHRSHLADEDPLPRCEVCKTPGTFDDPLVTTDRGAQVHRSHLPPRCEDCGQRGYAGDPLVIDEDGNRVHASHLQPHCRQCDLPGSSIDPLVTTENGTQVHASHLNPRCAACGQPGTVDDPLFIDADGERVHRSHQRETTPPPEPGPTGMPQHCQVCGLPGSDADPLMTNGMRVIHQSHLRPEEEAHCEACGQRGWPYDPLMITDDGARVHLSHLSDPDSGFYKPPAEPKPAADTPPAEEPFPADVTDAEGQPVDAVWEPPAAAWASLRK